MDNIAYLMHGFRVALTAYHLALMVAGVLFGILVGVLPGLGAPNGVTLLMPLTFSMEPVSAIILLASMYWGALFGGSTTSILFNIPGEPSSVATTFDGYPHGQEAAAPREALTLPSCRPVRRADRRDPHHVPVDLGRRSSRCKFSSPEYFAVYFLAFASFVGLGGASPLKTVVSMMARFRVRRRRHGYDLRQPAADLRIQRAARRHQFSGRGDRAVRHRRADRSPWRRGSRFDGVQGARQTARVFSDDRRDAALLGRADPAQRRGRMLDGNNAGRADRRVVHELWPRQALLEAPAEFRQGRAGRHRRARKPPITPPGQARCCRCWRWAFPARRPRP